MDIYDHGADLSILIKIGYIPHNNSYAEEYPALFILTTVLFNIMSINIETPFTFFRLFNICSLLFIITLIYIFALKALYKSSYIYKHFAIITPFAFMALNWTHIGHFAPHTHSFIMYLSFFISLINVVSNDKIWRKEWIVSGLILLLVINITNPTNATMLLLNILFMVLISFFYNLNLYKNVLSKRLFLLCIVLFIIFVGWLSFNGENVALFNAKRYINEFRERVGDLNKLQLPMAPNESFSLASKIRIVQTAFVVIMLISLSFLLIKQRVFSNEILILFSLVTSLILIIFVMFASDVLLTRMHVYLTIPFAIISSYIVAKRLPTNMRLLFMIIITIWFYITHITLYASDPHTYLTASLLYVQKILNEHFPQHGTMYAYSVANFGSFYYDSIDLQDNLKHIQYAERYQDKYRVSNDINDISARFVQDKINFILFSEVDNNRLIMRNNDSEFYTILKTNLDEKHFNRLFDVSSNTIFLLGN
ncbi:MAG: hypothetical protein QXJ44_02835 [Candidatus Nitrosocaldus sp.]